MSSTNDNSEAASPMGLSPAVPWSFSTVPHLLNKQEALATAQAVDSLSNLLSLIMLMIHPRVQVPMTRGTCCRNQIHLGPPERPHPHHSW